ncbi:MAG: hypothetical protein HUJ52_03955, partial [Malacoplasma sp.]|nr:hypothetical protein [Malacoplasma sp.]
KTKKRKSLWLGIGLGLILPVCAACITVPLVLLPNKIAAKNEFKFIIASSEGWGSEVPSVIHFTPEECEKYYFVNVFYNDEKDDVQSISVESSNPSKFGCEVERSKTQNNSLKQGWTWSIRIYVNEEAGLWDTADINFKIIDSQKREGRLTIGVVMKGSEKCLLTIPNTEHATYKINDEEITTPYSQMFNPGAEIKLEVTPTDEYVFKSWNDDQSTDNPRTFKLTSNKNISAVVMKENKMDWNKYIFKEQFTLKDDINPNIFCSCDNNGNRRSQKFEFKDGNSKTVSEWSQWDFVTGAYFGNCDLSITYLDKYFLSMTGVENVDFSGLSHITVIDDAFFFAATSIKSLDLRIFNKLTYIGCNFLRNCTGLKTIYLPDKDPSTIAINGSEFMSLVPKDCTLHAGKWVNEYKSCLYWSDWAEQIVE